MGQIAAQDFKIQRGITAPKRMLLHYACMAYMVPSVVGFSAAGALLKATCPLTSSEKAALQALVVPMREHHTWLTCPAQYDASTALALA